MSATGDAGREGVFEDIVRRLRGPVLGGAGERVWEVHIVGITGTEGTAIATLLCDRLGRGVRVVGHDFSAALSESFARSHVAVPAAERAARFEALMALPQLTVQTGERYLAGLDGADLIFVGQNWRAYPANRPALFEAEARIPFAQMMDLYLELAPCGLVGLTGTNGKTTTCNWLKAMAETERPALVSGNDLFSQQSLGELLEMPEVGLLILEMSNRQLRSVRKAPPVAGVTSLAPDHVEEHGGWEGYLAAKRRIVELQRSCDTAVLNADDEHVRGYASAAPGRLLWASASPLSAGEEGAFARDDALWMRLDGAERRLVGRDELALPGAHNLTNGLIAALMARVAGVSLDGIREGLKRFRGVKNRLQLIAKIGEVRYVNDLASTTPWATIAALKSAAPGRTHLILGGQVKVEGGYDALAEAITARAASVIALPGRVTELVREQLGEGAPPLREVASIGEAVSLAGRLAEPGQQVLLSPAGAGFYTAFLGKRGSFNTSVRRLRRGRVA